MATVRLSNSECRKRGRLPEVCMVCGAPTPLTVNRTFYWVPQWMYFLVGLLILILVFRKSMSFHVPLCSRHRYYFSIKTAIISVGFVTILILLFAIPLYYAEPVRGTPAFQSQFIQRDIWLISLGIFAVNGIILTLIVRSGIRPIRIDREGIAFKCVAPEFVQALEEMRNRESQVQESEIRSPRQAKPIQPALRTAKRVATPKPRAAQNDGSAEPLPDSAFD